MNLIYNNKAEPSGAIYRHEYKYEIDRLQLEVLRFKLNEVMEKDFHLGGTDRYKVRSLYFDDYRNSCYYDNENGNDPREKFRIRLYNGNCEHISLELKRKESGKTLKSSCPISKEQVQDIISGKNLEYSDDFPPLLKKFYLWSITRTARPVIIVEYDRTPFVYPDGNVRVTLDMNIIACNDIDRFLEPELFGRPVMPTGRHLLEVKFDQFIPDFINRTIPTDKLTRTTYSKYYLCRKFGGLK